MVRKLTRLIILMLTLGLLGCSPSRNEFNYAPVDAPKASVVRATPRIVRSYSTSNYHIVERGDTLYSIAWRYNLDYRRLARMNGISSPYALSVGQKLMLNFPARKATASKRVAVKASRQPVRRRTAKKPRRQSSAQLADKGKWIWPIKGRLVSRYNPKKGAKGINIEGARNQKIRAARSGHIAYASNGLRDYGNLIIIKHNNEYLSAYAHNKRMYVKEGQFVKKGQVIGLVGQSNNGRNQLHFEIRKAGNPVNPLNYLAKS